MLEKKAVSRRTAAPKRGVRGQTGVWVIRADGGKYTDHFVAGSYAGVGWLVEQVVSRVRHREIDLQPDFQRVRGIWDTRRKSRLIESLLLRIPIPVFYVCARRGPCLQRMTSRVPDLRSTHAVAFCGASS